MVPEWLSAMVLTMALKPDLGTQGGRPQLNGVGGLGVLGGIFGQVDQGTG
jgi:hypothetical protein